MIALLKAIENATGIKPIPLGTEKIEKCIVYNLAPVSDDGLVRQDRLQLRIITNSFEEAMEIGAKISKAVINFGDEAKLHGITNIVQNGGGSMKDYNTDTVHYWIFLQITKKSEVNSNG